MERAVAAAFGWPANSRRTLSILCAGRQRRPCARWRERLCPYLRQGAPAAGERLLVDHHVRGRPWLAVRADPLNRFTISQRVKLTSTARWRSVSSVDRPARTRKQIGYRPRRTLSCRCCGCSSRERRSPEHRGKLAATGDLQVNGGLIIRAGGSAATSRTAARRTAYDIAGRSVRDARNPAPVPRS